MNNLANTILTKVANFTEASSAIENAADKLLSRILLEENVEAWCYTKKWTCGHCNRGKRRCQRCCGDNGCRYQLYDCK